jgi:hypothetical protein
VPLTLNPFARLESQVSVAVFRNIAIVSIDGGADFGGIFDDDAAASGVARLAWQRLSHRSGAG